MGKHDCCGNWVLPLQPLPMSCLHRPLVALPVPREQSSADRTCHQSVCPGVTRPTAPRLTLSTLSEVRPPGPVDVQGLPASTPEGGSQQRAQEEGLGPHPVAGGSAGNLPTTRPHGPHVTENRPLGQLRFTDQFWGAPCRARYLVSPHNSRQLVKLLSLR